MSGTRLNVNIGTEPSAALHTLMERKGLTATEAIRQAISVWKFVEDQRSAGRSLAIIDGGQIRELVWPG